LVNVLITQNVCHPVMVLRDVAAAQFPVFRPGFAPVEEPGERIRTGGRIVRREQRAGLAVLDEFAVPADIRCRDDLFLRHGFKRLERGDEIGQPAELARIGEDVCKRIIAFDFTMRHAPDEADGCSSSAALRLRPQAGFAWCLSPLELCHCVFEEGA